MDKPTYQVWQCRLYINSAIKLSAGADAPFRRSVQVVAELRGLPISGIFSGWNAPVKENEIAVIENRLPADPLPGMSDINRTIAYSAAQKLRELGYEWDGINWIKGEL